jgi:O-antigen/teichoic acid export membrane protein
VRNVVGLVVLTAANGVSVLVLARGLTPETLGEVYTLYALILMLQLVFEAGLGSTLTRRLAQAPAAGARIIGETTALAACVVLVSAAVFIAGGAIWCWAREDTRLLLPCVAAGLTCAALQVMRFAAAVQHAAERFDGENGARVVQGVLFAVLAFALVRLGHTSLALVMVAMAVSHVAGALVLVVGLRDDDVLSCWDWRWPRFRDWLGEAVPLGIGDIGRGLIWQVDTVLLGLFQPAAAVGVFSVAFRPLGPLNLLPKAVLAAAFPSFARLAAQDAAALGRAFTDSLRILWVGSLPIVLTIWACAEPITAFLAGPGYREAAPLMGLLIWTAALSFLSAPIRYVLTATGMQSPFAWLVLGVLGFKVALEAALLPLWGCWGACAGSLLAELIFTVAGLALCRRLGFEGIEWTALLGATMAGAVFGAGLCAALPLGLPILIGVLLPLTGVYLGLCILLRALHWAELRRVANTLPGCSWLAQRRPEQAVP